MRVVLLALVLLAGPAHAESPKFTQTFQAGVDAFRLGKYDEAEALLSKASGLEPKLPGPHRFLAAVAQAQGRFADCIASARTAIQLNPRSQELGDTRKLHDACRASAGKPVYRGELGDGAAIAVTTSTPGATVAIDGLGYGGTPLAPRPIKPGSHEVTVEKTGYRSARATVDALAGIVTDVDLELTADASVTSQVERTAVTTGVVVQRAESDTVTIDGERVTGPPTAPLALAPGEHLLEVARAGKEPWRRRVMLAPGQRRTLVPAFETSRDVIRGRGWIMVGVGAGFAITGLVSGALAAGTDGGARTGWLAAMGASAAGAAICWTLGVMWLLEGRAADRDAPPPFALAPIEGGVLATSGFVW